jgi:hypothetical protein
MIGVACSRTTRGAFVVPIVLLLAMQVVACSPRVDGPRNEQSATKANVDSTPRSLVVAERKYPLDSTMTISEVATQLGGGGVMMRRGDTTSIALCDTIGHVRLDLLSDELGGPVHRLLGFELRRLRASGALPDGCSQTASALGLLSTENGLGLGLDREDVVRRLGQPTVDSGDSLEFERVVPHEAGGAQVADTTTYDELSRVIVWLSEGRVVRLLVWYVRTT